jgi:hypothetical protein
MMYNGYAINQGPFHPHPMPSHGHSTFIPDGNTSLQ